MRQAKASISDLCVMRSTGLLLFLWLFGTFVSPKASAQPVVYQPLQSGVYELLDELAAEGTIELNSAVKPYSRQFIAQKLKQAEEMPTSNSKRLANEVAFYLRDFQKELPTTVQTESRILKPLLKPILNPEANATAPRFDALFYRDSLFTFTLNPVTGLRFVANDQNNTFHRWAGAEAWAYIGPHVGIAASYRDNRQRLMLSGETFLSREQGAVYKPFNRGTGGDFSEARGGITYGWKWGHVALVKEFAVWGNNNRGANILSGHSPSLPQIRFNAAPVKWVELSYIHAWLVSDEIDSSRSYTNSRGQQREVYRPKYIAANILTFKPFKKLHASVGNSIIYADQSPNPAYLLPIMYYKSVDHTLNNFDSNTNNVGQNAQFFFDINSRQIKHLHLFATAFVDEISLTRAFKEDLQTNFISLKLGARLANWPVKNLSLMAEYTRNNPYTYKHFNQTTTFESNRYNMGHFLRENAEEVYFGLRWKPIRSMRIEVFSETQRKGPEPVYLVNGVGDKLRGYPFMTRTLWERSTLGGSLTWEFLHDAWVTGSVQSIQQTNANVPLPVYQPSWQRGSFVLIDVSLNYGF